MAIDLFWDDEAQSVILAEFKGKWTWQELHAMLSTVKRLSRERQQVFGAIVDLREGLHLPNGSVFNREGLNNFRKILALSEGEHEKGALVVVGMNSLLRSVLDAIKTIDKNAMNAVFFADNLESARQTLYPEMARDKRVSA